MKPESQVLNIPIEDIIPNRFQPRLNFDEEGLQELASSIKEHGIIQPLVLRRLGDKYEIIAGERRYKASKLAGLTYVPGIITTMDDQKSAEVAIVENIQRRDLSSIEEAKSYKSLLDRGYLTQEELAKKMGLSQSAISNKLRLLTLDPRVQDALMEGKISERHARSLLQVPTQEQEKWLRTIIDERITVRELDKRLKNMIEKEKKEEVLEVKESTESLEIPVIPEINQIKVEENIPNKFFNFLEDESVNMIISEPTIEESKEMVVEEEIEMLDFLAPDTTVELINENKIIKEKFSKLEEELKELGFTIRLETMETDNIIKYIIDIDKK